MAIKAFRGMSPISQLLFAAFVILASFLVFFIISIITAIPFVGIKDMISTLTGYIDSPHAIMLLKYFQVIQSIGLFVVPPFIIAYLYEGEVKKYLQLNNGFTSKNLILTITIIVISMPFIGFIGEINSNMKFPGFMKEIESWMHNMEDNAAVLIERFIKVETTWGLLFNLFMIAVIPALGEELLFRGVVQKIIIKLTKSPHWGIWISAFLFSALHMQFFGFIPRMLLGGLFGYILVWTKSIWLPILGHFFNNTIGVLALHAQHQENETLAKAGEFTENLSVSWIVAFLSLAITILFMLILKKNSEQNYNTSTN